MDSWLDHTGDDLALILDTGRLVSAAPLGFGGPRFIFERAGDLLEITPTIDNGISCFRITNRGSASHV